MCKRIKSVWPCGCASFEWQWCPGRAAEMRTDDLPCNSTRFDPNDPNRGAVAPRGRSPGALCCSTQCCQEDMNAKVYLVDDMENRYLIEAGDAFDQRKNRAVQGQAAETFFEQANVDMVKAIGVHFDHCLPRHATNPVFRNESKERNGREPCYPPTPQVPNRPEVTDALRWKYQNAVQAWSALPATAADIAYFHGWQARMRRQARVPAPPLGLPDAAAPSMGMCISARAPPLDQTLTQLLNTSIGLNEKIFDVLTHVLNVPEPDINSPLAVQQARESNLNSCRYEVLRIEAVIINANAPHAIASIRNLLLAELARLIKSLNKQRTGYDLTITNPPPPLHFQTLLLEVLDRITGFANGQLLYNSIVAFKNGLATIGAPPTYLRMNTEAEARMFRDAQVLWSQTMKKKEVELRDMDIARHGPAVTLKKRDLRTAFRAAKLALKNKKRSAWTVRGDIVYSSGDDDSDSDDDDNPPPPDTSGGRGGPSQQGGHHGSHGQGGYPPSGKGKGPDRSGGGGGDGGSSVGGGFRGQYQASYRHGLSSDAAIVSDKQADARNISTQLGRSPSRIPFRSARNGEKKTTAGSETTTSWTPSAPSNGTGLKTNSSTISTTSKISGKQAQRGIQNATSERVDANPKSNATKQPASAAPQILPNQGGDRIKKSLKAVRVDDRKEDDYVKKGNAGRASEGRRKP